MQTTLPPALAMIRSTAPDIFISHSYIFAVGGSRNTFEALLGYKAFSLKYFNLVTRVTLFIQLCWSITVVSLYPPLDRLSYH